jgi:hypothetical protein
MKNSSTFQKQSGETVWEILTYEKEEILLQEIHNRNLFKGILFSSTFIFSFFHFYNKMHDVYCSSMYKLMSLSSYYNSSLWNSITKITVVCLPKIILFQQTSRENS